MPNYRDDWCDPGKQYCRRCEQAFVILTEGGADANFCPFCGQVGPTSPPEETEAVKP